MLYFILIQFQIQTPPGSVSSSENDSNHVLAPAPRHPCGCKLGYECNEDKSGCRPIIVDCTKENQIYRVCTTRTPSRCGNYKTRISRPYVCGPPICECKDGFHLNGKFECITRRECERESLGRPFPN
ncbi:hypothetical protein PMAYCL1PPCAC_20660 [Pristionchus mayeri]|uniref:TIL domain-containing protein n=1 Tax=Pristionchus mayeri TaxID=1317129 RepID=A0AAN5CTX6_9BILA|nr:hypothetical protein PMAYCL1PPCAC_20660 [Pristionchus mayeri]